MGDSLEVAVRALAVAVGTEMEALESRVTALERGELVTPREWEEALVRIADLEERTGDLEESADEPLAEQAAKAPR